MNPEDRKELENLMHEIWAMAQGPQPICDAVEAMTQTFIDAGYGKVNPWIPVDGKELPEDGETVHVFNGWGQDTVKFWYGDSFPYTHWQRLPPPPVIETKELKIDPEVEDKLREEFREKVKSSRLYHSLQKETYMFVTNVWNKTGIQADTDLKDSDCFVTLEAYEKLLRRLESVEKEQEETIKRLKDSQEYLTFLGGKLGGFDLKGITLWEDNKEFLEREWDIENGKMDN